MAVPVEAATTMKTTAVETTIMKTTAKSKSK